MAWTRDSLKQSASSCIEEIKKLDANWDNYLENWKKKGELKRGIVALSVGKANKSRIITIEFLLLADKNEAISWAKKATESYADAGKVLLEEHKAFESSLLNALELAVVSGDKKLIKEISSVVIKLDGQRLIPIFYYIKAMSGIILGDDTTASNFVEKLQAPENAKLGTIVETFKGNSTSLKGILAKDKSLVIYGVTQVLRDLDNLISKISHEFPLSITAIVLLLLAKDRGIIIKKEEIDEKFREYIPWLLLEDD